jgi:hypothetical protein
VRKQKIGENFITKSFMVCPPNQIRVHYCQGDQAKALAADVTWGHVLERREMLIRISMGKGDGKKPL